MLRPAGQTYGHAGAGQHALAAQKGAQAECALRELSIRDRCAVTACQCHAIRRALRVVKESFVQQSTAGNRVGVIHGDAHSALPFWKQVREGRRPPEIDFREPMQQLHVCREHVIEATLGKQILDSIPVHVKRPGVLHHLIVQPHLRCLRQSFDVIAKRHGKSDQRSGYTQCAGEYDGHGYEPSVAPTELAHHLDGRALLVLQRDPKLLLESACRLSPPGTSRRPVGNQDERCEVAEDVGDIRVYFTPIEYGEVQRKRALLTPAAQHLGIGGREHDGGRQPVGSRMFLNRAPCPDV